MPTSLIVHAGLRPGELFIQRADHVGSGRMIILPPANHVAHFDIQSGRDGRWNLVRKQGTTQSPTLEEILMDFDTREQAQKALLDLAGLLMQADPETDVATNTTHDQKVRRRIELRLPIALLAIFVVALLVLLGKSLMTDGEAPAPSQAIPEANMPTQTPAATTTPANPAAMAPAVIPPPAQDKPAAKPDSSESLSPGDEFARMINGG